MGKLFNLKEWLTVADAARHLSIVFGEGVTEADVLRLALDGRLRLSVNLVNHAVACYGKKIPIGDAKYKDIPSLDGTGMMQSYEGTTIFTEGRPSHVLEVEKGMVEILGVYDLPMIGNEHLDVESKYQLLTGGPVVDFTREEGAIVEDCDGQLYQLQTYSSPDELEKMGQLLEKFEDFRETRTKIACDKEMLKKYIEIIKSKPYSPALGLPETPLVVRTSALREFEQSVNESHVDAKKPITTTEKNTLLTIIASLCNYSAIEHQGRGVAAQIAKFTEEIGTPITDDTIRDVLKKIPDALASRMK